VKKSNSSVKKSNFSVKKKTFFHVGQNEKKSIWQRKLFAGLLARQGLVNIPNVQHSMQRFVAYT
jgi:hypothetical protein